MIVTLCLLFLLAGLPLLLVPFDLVHLLTRLYENGQVQIAKAFYSNYKLTS